MLRITQLKVHYGAGDKDLKRSVRKALRLKEGEAFSYEVLRRSLDARKKPDLYEIYTLRITLSSRHAEQRVLKAGLRNVEAYEPNRYRYSSPSTQAAPCSQGTACSHASSAVTDPERPVIIGTGPAGLFCSLLLARQNLRPILIERGQRAKERGRSVERFWNGEELNPESNVQFGEGGAGTFSDGKLNTCVKDPDGRIRFILETFAEAGADKEILCSARPHIGTDVLRKVIAAIRDEICFRGGEVYFETRMDQMHLSPDGIWQISCIRKGLRLLPFSTRHLVLAIGHSARDTFSMLQKNGICLTPKPFAVGVRILHPQSMIDRAMYGDQKGRRFPAASYKLTHRLSGGRGVYSFCMCPGGYVVNASSEKGHLAVNGMSYHSRASGSANSAIVVTVTPQEIAGFLSADRKDIMSFRTDSVPHETAIMKEFFRAETSSGSADALIGMEFQRMLERSAFEAGQGAIPLQKFQDFLSPGSFCGELLPDFEPEIMGQWKMADIRSVFPKTIRDGIAEGILSWERQIEGFSGSDALLCAAESRTSSPVRIERDKNLQALGYPGLYPCGEGAGYAGGITSAALDGLKVAEQILNS